MGKMKEIYTKYQIEWEDHMNMADCRRNDPDDGCWCEQWETFEEYANFRFEQEYGNRKAITSDMQDTLKDCNHCDCDEEEDCDEDCDCDEEDCDDDECYNSDDICEDCGEDCGGDIVGCGECGYSHCEYDPHCPANQTPRPVQTWSQLNAVQDPADPQTPADPPTWSQLNADPNDELTVPIDLKELDLEISELDGFTMREPNEMDKLRSGNAGKRAGEQCWRCKGRLQQLGNSEPFCGKCELELEKK